MSHAAGSFFFPVAACRFANRVSTGSSRSEAAPRVCHAAARAAIARYARPARAGIERSEQARFMRRRAARLCASVLPGARKRHAREFASAPARQRVRATGGRPLRRRPPARPDSFGNALPTRCCPANARNKFGTVRAFVVAIPYSSILTKTLHSMERGCLMTSA
ncbi:hypothetical protein F9948_10330 [Burkholderia thailandensis]|nr:hypothetical protein [Burkholderia thailandensis]MDD1487754.1 hypothetical protein [Burkholderia thailandensis]MDD1493677.1 hypothetical protein [Burkholderia thailandensis]